MRQRLNKAKRQTQLSQSQLAELAELPGSRRLAAEHMDALMSEIRALGHIPRQNKALRDECSLANRLRKAKSRRLLSESQLAELAELARISDEPLRKRLRVLD